MIKFGPAGNSISFYEEGNTKTIQAPKWVKEKGLDAFEYSFGKGYTLSADTAKLIGNEFNKYGIALSLHAPYFINFANPSEEMFEKTKNYIRNGIKYMKLMSADRLVFHPASCGKMKREEAFELTKKRLSLLIQELDKDGLIEGVYLCPETMGKSMQIGTYKEIIDLCKIHPNLLPAFDFGHINALTMGGLKTVEDYKMIFDYCKETLGEKRTKNCHIHFSKIEYGAKGEIRHLNFDDTKFGPDFYPLAICLKEQQLSPRIICESAGKMAEDALEMKNIYNKIGN